MSSGTNITDQQITAPYGSWATPFFSRAIVKDTIGYGTIVIDGGDIYWIETRPAEEGRHVIVCRKRDGTVSDVLPPGYNARTRVHEYGGGAFTVNAGIVYFTQFDDQQLYILIPGHQPQCLNTRPGMRFGDLIFDNRFQRLVAVCQDHRKDDEEAINMIVSVSLDKTGDYRILAAGADFYSSPKISPDGKRLAWISWKHPSMPWDSSNLYIADFADSGKLGKPLHIAGGEFESIVQPEWAPDATLYFISDKTDWWNIYRFKNNQVDQVLDKQAEFARPSWHLGNSSYAVMSHDELLCSYNVNGFWHLGVLDVDGKKLAEIKSEFTDIWWLKISGTKAVFRGASPQKTQAIMMMDLANKSFHTVVTSARMPMEPSMVSMPEAIEFPSGDGRAHGLFYPPKNKNYRAPANEKPPLIVKVHGGPTSIASTMLNLELQFWTSRGFAVLDLNYRGSSGFGRKYREQLHGNWGTVDVEDCVNGARFLIERGDVDEQRIVISGGSAGGYTVLAAATTSKLFKAGACYYGICDLEAMMRDTHKFESCMLEKLVGPYPRCRGLYKARSAIHHPDKVSFPLIFFQGLEDKIVPPNQTVMMMESLKKRGIPVACLMFPGEQHGFRGGETIRRSLDGELFFYAKVMGFKIPGDVAPVEITNLSMRY